MSPREVLWTEGPADIRVVTVGMDESMRELVEYERQCTEWVMNASEAKLNEMIALAEEMLTKPVLNDLKEHAIDMLFESWESRGTPSLDELDEIAKRVGSESMRNRVRAWRDATTAGRD